MVKRPPAESLVYPPLDNPDAPRTTLAAAEHFGVSDVTILRWIKAGHLAEFRPPPPPPRHGTAYSYINLRCRCSECRAWNTSAQRRHRASRAARGESAAIPHGTVGGYGNWRCRCEDCAAAHSEMVRAAYRSRIERAKADPSVVPTHGLSGYTGWGCRCDVCRDASVAETARRKALKAVTP